MEIRITNKFYNWHSLLLLKKTFILLQALQSVDYKEYFKIPKHQMLVSAPLKLVGVLDKMGITVRVAGGGIGMQAEAVRHGLSRALILFNEEFKKVLKHAGFVTRDARSVERKKYGLKKARRAPQWQKR